MVFSNTYYFVSVSLLLRAYVLVDGLDFVVVLFQRSGFEYIMVYSGWGGGIVYICKSYLCAPRKLLPRAKNEFARDV